MKVALKIALWWMQSDLEMRQEAAEVGGLGMGVSKCGVRMSKVMTKWSEDDCSWVLQSLKVTGPWETTVVSMAEGLSKRCVDPRKEARVAEPSF